MAIRRAISSSRLQRFDPMNQRRVPDAVHDRDRRRESRADRHDHEAEHVRVAAGAARP
jgi:hypothetical protein